MKVPVQIHSGERMFQEEGKFQGGSELARDLLELSLQGSSWPGNEKAR